MIQDSSKDADEHPSFHSPLSPKERIRELDMIRGFALLGILIANMPFFSYPNTYYEIVGTNPWNEPYDLAAQMFIQIFAESKFFTMFSFLFGFGFMVFMDRAAEKGERVTALFSRRLLILLVIGLVHSVFIWLGDILTMYALLGFMLLVFRKRQAKTVLKWGVALLIVPSLLMTLLFGASMAVDPSAGEEEWEEQFHEHIEEMIVSSLINYGEGSYADIVVHRLADLAFMYTGTVFMIPITLAMFLFGVYVYKKEIHRNLDEQLPFIRKVWSRSFLIGLPFVVLGVISSFTDNPLLYMTYYISISIGGPAFCFWYITSIVLLAQKETWRRFFRPLEAVGRMALSNYLLQSLVCTTIFYSYGLGLYGSVGPLAGLGITAALFTAQIIVSNAWLRRYRFGPMEWLWRSLTYGRRQPMK